jgi:hypothetical protein
MLSSSASIGELADALAKAQVELVNPEKGLAAWLSLPNDHAPPRRFRYASLSSGLELIRQALGRRQIAFLQTTAIDRDAGLLCLRTALVHASGQWIASEWPVCRLTELAWPHRIGAAMTYARRYALFALVGIAGEDDLDAPDLETTPIDAGGPNGEAELRRLDDAQERRNDAPPTTASSASRSLDERDQTLCARLLDEIADLESEDAASRWALVRFRAKRALSRPYAARVEESFSARLSQLAADRGVEAEDEAGDGGQADALRLAEGSSGVPAPRSFTTPAPPLAAQETPLAMTTLSDPVAAGRSDGAPEPALAAIVAARPARSGIAPRPARLRDQGHLRFVAGEPCLVCGRSPADPHHLRYLQPRALGRKVSDEFTVPLCRGHHRELHRMGDERQWWRERAVDPQPIALELWRRSRGDPSSQPPPEPTAPSARPTEPISIDRAP